MEALEVAQNTKKVLLMIYKSCITLKTINYVWEVWYIPSHGKCRIYVINRNTRDQPVFQFPKLQLLDFFRRRHSQKSGEWNLPGPRKGMLLCCCSCFVTKPPLKKNPTKNSETQQPSTPNPKPPNPKPLNPKPLPPKQKQLAPPWAPLGPRWRAPVPGPGSHVDAPRPDWSSFKGPGVGVEALRFRAV